MLDSKDEIATKNIKSILEYCKNPEEGLPENVFLMISSLVPVPNVDLLITNDIGEILLSWRSDIFYGSGWSLIGGCLRYGESFELRVYKTAEKEIGQEVDIIRPKFEVVNVLRGDNDNLEYKKMRGHHVAVLYECRLKGHLDLCRQKYKPGETGHLRWFKRIPENILAVHHSYDKVFKEYNLL